MKLIYFACLLVLPMLVSSQHLQETPSLQSESEVSFKLYPNPAYTDVVFIKTSQNGDKHVTVYDVFGKIVLDDKLRGNSLDISKLVSGVYLLKVVLGDATMTRKLIVK